MRAVLDPNVLISALLAPTGAPAKVLRAWVDGAYELVASPLLLAELARALAYPKLARHIEPTEAAELVHLLEGQATVLDDPGHAGLDVCSPDPGDDYLIALAATARAVLVSGDGDLLGLADRVPVRSPAQFLATLG